MGGGGTRYFFSKSYPLFQFLARLSKIPISWKLGMGVTKSSWASYFLVLWTHAKIPDWEISTSDFGLAIGIKNRFYHNN